MPDSYVLYGPGGASPLQLGTYALADNGPDFDPQAMLESHYVETPYSEGALSHRSLRVRRLRFPLRVASGPYGSLTAFESLLRRNTEPGGYIDLQPEGTPSAEAVRFDILAGRWLPDYRLRINTLQRRGGTLELDVSPYGYWPTWITLASAASVGYTGVLALGAVLGDAPGLARLTIQPSVATSFDTPIKTDFIAWSFAGRPSHIGLWRVASTTFAADSAIVATVRPIALAKAFEGATVMQLDLTAPGPNSFRLLSHTAIPTAIEPAMRGRHRVFLAAAVNASHGFNLSVDVCDTVHGPMGSANPVATAWNYYAVGSGAMLLDLGEITIPRVGSGISQAPLVRFWGKPATTNYASAIASPLLFWHGFYLHPLEGHNGILPRGLSFVASGPYEQATSWGLQIDGQTREALLRAHTSDLSVVRPAGNAFRNYRGDLPQVGASTAYLHLLLAESVPTSMAVYLAAGPARHGISHAAVSVQYRPRFQFLKGL